MSQCHGSKVNSAKVKKFLILKGPYEGDAIGIGYMFEETETKTSVMCLPQGQREGMGSIVQKSDATNLSFLQNSW